MIRSLVLSFLLLGFASCGLLLAPSRYEVLVTSVPAGARVSYRGRMVGRTPCSVAVTRDGYELSLRLPGYHDRRAHVGAVRNGWIACNALNFGVGLLVDLAVGADRNPDTRPVEVELSPRGGRAFAAWRRLEAPRGPGRTSGPPSGLWSLVAGLLEALACGRSSRGDE